MDTSDNNYLNDLATRLLTAENLVLAAQHRIQELDRRLEALEKRPRRDDDQCDFRTTLIVVLTPKATTTDRGCLDETIVCDSYAEAEAKQAEILARRNSQKRKVLIAVERSFTPVPF